MTCPDCDRRHAQEQKQLSDCEGRCKEMSVKNQRLAIALAVVATLAGKESLDYALGLSSTLEGLSSANAEEPDSNTFQVVSSFPYQFKRAKHPPRKETVLFLEDVLLF